MGVIKRPELIEDTAFNWPKEYRKELEAIIALSKKLGTTQPKAKSTDPKAKKNITELQKAQKQLNTANQKGNTLVIKAKAELDRKNKTTREAVKVLNDNLALENKQLGTLERLTLSNKKLVEERKKLNLETAKGQKELKRINTTLDKNNAAIQKNVSGLEKQKINVGAYGSKISGLPGPLGNAARATQGLTSASLKFIATPIGAVIAAIGLALGTLTSFFKTSEEGQNSLAKITAAASVVWDNLLDIVSSLGKAFFLLLKGDFAGMKDAFNEATDGVKNFIAETKKDIATQNKISDLRAKNIKLQRTLTVDEGKLLRKSNELREQAAEIEETNAAKAVQLVKIALEAEDELARRREEVSKNRIKILKVEATLANSTTEVLDEIAVAERELEDIQGRRSKRARTILKEINGLQRKANTQAKEAAKIAKEAATDVAATARANAEAIKEAQTEIKGASLTPEEQVDLWVPSTDGLKKRIDANIEVYKEGQDKIKDIDEKNKEDRNEIIAASIDTAKQIFSDFTQLRIQQITQELTALEFSRNRELELVKGNKRGEAEVNKKFDAQRRQLEKEQLNANKANALFNIAINTAVAIARVAGQIPLMILAAATGAAAAAVVLAQKVPEFDKGTESTPKDYKISEKRPELQRHKGKWSLFTKPTIVRNSPGDKIISGKETDSILGNMADLAGHNLLTDKGGVLSLLNNELRIEKRQDSNLAYVLEKNNADLIRTIKNKKEVNIRVRNAKVTERSGNQIIHRINYYYNR